ncbi:MAG: hypothetical protein P1V19_15330 [Gimesia sp.]|nr:hypothetical protein [Gimesia sp.]
MSLMYWVYCCCLLMVAGAIPPRVLTGVVQAAPFLAGLLMTAIDCCEGRRGVKFILMREAWLIAVEPCSNSGLYASNRDRNVSIKYETAGTGEEMTGEDFQNTGTFIVVRDSVFAKSSAHKTHLARDAYNAYWDTS